VLGSWVCRRCYGGRGKARCAVNKRRNTLQVVGSEKLAIPVRSVPRQTLHACLACYPGVSPVHVTRRNQISQPSHSKLERPRNLQLQLYTIHFR
jgi:hypothetical protein